MDRKTLGRDDLATVRQAADVLMLAAEVLERPYTTDEPAQAWREFAAISLVKERAQRLYRVVDLAAGEEPDGHANAALESNTDGQRVDCSQTGRTAEHGDERD